MVETSRDRPRTGAARGSVFAGLVVTFLVVMMGTTLPTPMYAVYRQVLGFSATVQTVVFAVYAIGVVAALLLFGRWSDQLGRRPLLLAALGVALLSAIVFLLADTTLALLAARLLSGVSAGIVTGAATAAVIEAAPPSWSTRSSSVATAASSGGLGLGPMLAGLAVQFLPAPLHLSFVVHAALVVLCGGLVALAPETVSRTPRPRLRPRRLAVPTSVRPVFVSAATAGFAGFAVLGLFTAISPRILAEVLGEANHAVAGLMSFLLFATSVVAQLGLQRFDVHRTLVLGCALLVVGILLVALALATASFVEFVAGALITGVGQGMSFSKGLAAVNALVDPAQRAEVTSSFFLVLYVALSLPVVGVGAGSSMWGLVPAGLVFCLAVAALAATALVALLVLHRRDRSSAAQRGEG